MLLRKNPSPGLSPPVKPPGSNPPDARQDPGAPLAGKREAKILQLEKANRDLQREIAEHRAGHRLDQSATLLRIACTTARLGGWTIEMPGRTLTWSDETCRIHDVPPGYKPTLEEGVMLFLPEHRTEVIRHVEACISDGISYDFEVPKHTVTGRRIWVRSIGEAVRDEKGNIIRLQGAFQDITENKRVERQFFRAQRMESIGTVAGGLAHDFNNILAPILMSIGLFKLDETDPARLELLTHLEKSANHGAALVRRVLSFAEGVEGHRVPIDLVHLTNDLKEIVRNTFPENIDIRVKPAHDLWPVKGDATQVHQVLLNLCVNARDAMPSGGQLSIRMRNIVLDRIFTCTNPEAKPGDHVMIWLEDTGTGIPHNLHERIFDPFFTTKAFGKGSGLSKGSASKGLIREAKK